MDHPIDEDGIRLRITLVKSALISVDAQIVGAGVNYRENSETEFEKEGNWAIMYLAQVYAQGLLDELEGLEKVLEKIKSA